MNALERTQEVADVGPHAFNGVDVNLTDPIAIIIPGPFRCAVTNGCSRANNVVVAPLLIGVDLSINQGEGVDVRFEGFGICMLDDP